MYRLYWVLLLPILAGCDFFQPKETAEENPVARVHDRYLYVSDLSPLIPQGSSKEDSAMMADRFINDWINKQLIIARALEEEDINEVEMEQKVLDYRYALMRSTFEKKYISENISEDIPIAEIQSYYDEHNADFVLKQNIVRCLFVQIPKPAAGQDIFERNLRAYPEQSSISELRNYCTQHAIRSFIEDSVWVDFNEVIADTPFSDILDRTRMVRNSSLLESSDDDYNYFIRILEYKMVDDVSPIEFVQEDIENILINRRKIELKQELEKIVYNEAVSTNAFEIYSR